MKIEAIRDVQSILGIRVKSIESQEILCSFLNTLSLINLERVIGSLNSKTGISFNNVGILFYSDLDPSEIDEVQLNESEVLVFDNLIGESKVDITELYDVLDFLLTELLNTVESHEIGKVETLIEALRNGKQLIMKE